MADDNLMNQDEIENLLSQGKDEAADESPPQAGQADAGAEPLDQGEIESLMGGGTQPSTAQAGAPEASDDDDKLLGQDDIEKLLDQAGTAPANALPQPAPSKETPPPDSASAGLVVQGDVDYLLDQAERALGSIDSADADELPQGVTTFQLDEFRGSPASTENATLDLIRDVELDLKIELGRTHMYLEDVLKLRKGSVVPLDKLAGDPVDIYVNGRLIARGEVLVLNDNFCVRVAELISGTNVYA